MKGRREISQLKRIPNRQGISLEDKGEIIVNAIDFYHEQYFQERDSKDVSLLRHITSSFCEDENIVLC